MPIVAIVGPLLLIAALVVALVAFGRWRNRKITEIFTATRAPGARAHAPCMLRVFGRECPAVALATDDELVLHSLFGNVRRIPLAHLALKQETPGSGRSGWWGKRMFHLTCPEEPLLVLGFDDPAPWRTVFQCRRTANIQQPK